MQKETSCCSDGGEKPHDCGHLANSDEYVEQATLTAGKLDAFYVFTFGQGWKNRGSKEMFAVLKFKKVF